MGSSDEGSPKTVLKWPHSGLRVKKTKGPAVRASGVNLSDQ